MNSRLQILLLLLLLGLPCHAATGGPDSFGYCWIDSGEAGGPSPQWN